MQIDLVLRACGSMLQTLKSSSLDEGTKRVLEEKVQSIVQKAIDPSRAEDLEQILHSDECAELGDESAQLVLYQRVYKEIVKDTTQKTRAKMEEVARVFIPKPSTKQLSERKAVHLGVYTDESRMTKFGTKKNLEAQRGDPPFDSIPSLKSELDRKVKPDKDLGGEYKDILEHLAKKGITTKRDILSQSTRQLTKKLGYTAHKDKSRVQFFRHAVVESLKSIHQRSFEEDLISFLEAIEIDSLNPSGTTQESLLNSEKNIREFKSFVDKLVEKKYDPKFELSNSPLETLASKTGVPESTLQQLVFEARVEAFAQSKLALFKERAEQEDDLDTLYCQFFDSLIKNYAREKGERIDVEDLAHLSIVFQTQVNRLAPLVQSGKLDKTKALSQLKFNFLTAFEDESVHKESLTREDFLSLPAKALPNALSRKLRSEINEGTWKEGEEREIELPNISPHGASRLRTNFSIISTSPSFVEASRVFFEKVSA